MIIVSIDLIKNYTSNIEQEIYDKKRILDAYDKYGDELFYRECEMMHFTSSSLILNKNRDKVLMVYHNIYDSYSWTGVHTRWNDNLYRMGQGLQNFLIGFLGGLPILIPVVIVCVAAFVVVRRILRKRKDRKEGKQKSDSEKM